ncbi:hypothetical protein CHUAL_007663 [Chamberlinius hualienensis]
MSGLSKLIQKMDQKWGKTKKGADPLKEKLELWQAEKGRQGKPTKPWLPKYKKIVNKTSPSLDVVKVSISNSSKQNSEPLPTENDKESKTVDVVKAKNANRQPISYDENMKTRKELLEEWKNDKKLREARAKELKEKERRWTICGLATNRNMRDSSASFDWLKHNESLLSSRSFIKPTADSSDNIPAVVETQQAPQTKKLFRKSQTLVRMTDKSYTRFTTTAKPVAIKPIVSKISNGKENVQPAVKLVDKKVVTKGSAPAVKPKPPLVKSNASKISISSADSSKLPSGDSSTTSLKISQGNANVQRNVKRIVSVKPVIPVKLNRAQMLAAKPSVKPHAVKSEPAIKVNNFSVTNKPRKSTSGPNIGGKNTRVSLSSLHANSKLKGKAAGVKVGIDHKPKSADEAQVLMKSGGGILKTACKNVTTPKVKKSVVIISPIISPDTPSLNQRLVNWLVENDQSPLEYRNLQNLAIDTSLPEIQPLDCEVDESVKSPGTPDTVTLDTNDSSEEESLKRYHKTLAELNELLQKSFPVDEASEWLDLMYEKVPNVRLIAGYWLCRARVSLRCGCSQEEFAELITEGINAGAQPAQELVRFKNKTNRTSTPRPSKLKCQKENIFDSTLIRYKVDEMEPKIVVEKSVKVTPVRRSQRLQSFHTSEKTFSALTEIPEEMKLRLVLTPNKFLDVDSDSTIDKDF